MSYRPTQVIRRAPKTTVAFTGVPSFHNQNKPAKLTPPDPNVKYPKGNVTYRAGTNPLYPTQSGPTNNPWLA